MLFQPSFIWQWFCKKTLFQKFILFIPVIIVVLIIGMFFVLFRKDFDSLSPDIDPIERAKNQQEKFYKKQKEKITKKNKEFMNRINKEAEKRKKILEKQKIRTKKIRRKHAAIDKSNSISDVDDILKHELK